MSNKAKEMAALTMERLKELQNGFTTDGRKYTFDSMPFKDGKKILAYMTMVNDQIAAGQLGFIDTEKFEQDIEPLLIKYTQVDGFNLETLEGHFDNHPSDYFQFVINSLQGFSSVFMPESNTSSHSTSTKSSTVTLRKPM